MQFRPGGECNIIDSSDWKAELWQYLILDVMHGLLFLGITVFAVKMTLHICFVVLRDQEGEDEDGPQEQSLHDIVFSSIETLSNPV